MRKNPFVPVPLYFLLAGLVFSFFCTAVKAQEKAEDWLVDGKSRPAKLVEVSPKEIQLTNGLIRRSFHLSPNLVCYDFTNLSTGEQLLRTVMPEARVTLDGKVYEVGGSLNLKERGFFKKEWLSEVSSPADNFQYQSYAVSEITPLFPSKSQFWASGEKGAKGKRVSFSYTHPDLSGVVLKIHYEIYDDLPLIGKYLTLENGGQKPIHINQVVHEILGTVEEESAVVGSTGEMKKPHQLYVESDFAFNNSMNAELSDQARHWKQDSAYTSQVNYNYQTPSTLEIYPEKGIGIDLQPKEDFRSIRSYELVLDSYDRERNGLARRKMYRALTPWAMQNPIFMHLSARPTSRSEQPSISASRLDTRP